MQRVRQVDPRARTRKSRRLALSENVHGAARVDESRHFFEVHRVDVLGNRQDVCDVSRDGHLVVFQSCVGPDDSSRGLIAASSHDVRAHLAIFSTDARLDAFYRSSVGSVTRFARAVVEGRCDPKFQRLKGFLKFCWRRVFASGIELVVGFDDLYVLVREIVVAEISRGANERPARGRQDRQCRQNEIFRMNERRVEPEQLDFSTREVLEDVENILRTELDRDFFFR